MNRDADLLYQQGDIENKQSTDTLLGREEGEARRENDNEKYREKDIEQNVEKECCNEPVSPNVIRGTIFFFMVMLLIFKLSTPCWNDIHPWLTLYMVIVIVFVIKANSKHMHFWIVSVFSLIAIWFVGLSVALSHPNCQVGYHVTSIKCLEVAPKTFETFFHVKLNDLADTMTCRRYDWNLNSYDGDGTPYSLEGHDDLNLRGNFSGCDGKDLSGKLRCNTHSFYQHTFSFEVYIPPVSVGTNGVK